MAMVKCRVCGGIKPDVAFVRNWGQRVKGATCCRDCAGMGPASRRDAEQRPVFDAAGFVGDVLEQAAAEHRAALHEAGHAYVLWRLGMPFAEVGIGERGEGFTARTGVGPAWTVAAAAQVLMAGGAAERLAYPEADDDGCDEDEERVYAILTGRARDEPVLRARTDVLVRAGRPAIEALARVLGVRRHLTGAQAVAVFAEHQGVSSVRSAVLTACVRSYGFEARSAGAGDGRTLEGYAAVFNTPTKIRDWEGDFEETILPGAFARSLKERTPVLQYDHGRDPKVGGVPIGAIEQLREDGRGLYVRARLFEHPDVERVRQAIAGKALRGMSFRFEVPPGGDTWTSRAGRPDLREIRDADIHELGPVVFPAYDTTTVGVRSAA